MHRSITNSGEPRLHSAFKDAALVFIYLLLATVSVCATAGGIYKSIDSEGNVVFTDQPSEDAETINEQAKKKRTSSSKSEGGEPDDDEPESVDDNDSDDDFVGFNSGSTVLVAPEPLNPPKPETTEAEEPRNNLPISRVEILTPEHDTTVIDPLGQIWVEVQSYPTPMSQSGLIAQLWMDDKLVTADKNTVLRLPPPPRGTRTLQIKLVDEKGRLFQVSQSIQIHVKYRSAQQ